MRDRAAIALRVSSGALVLAGYLAMAALDDYGPGILAIPLVFLALTPLGEWLERRFKAYRVLSTATLILCLCSIPLALLVFGLLGAVVTLVMFVQAYTLLHEKRARNYYHLYLMAFFLLLAACVQSPQPVFGLVLLLFLVSAVWAFLCLRLHEESRQSRSQTLPDILALDATVPDPGHVPQNLFDLGLVVAVTLVSIAGVVLTATVFVITPRVEAGFLGRGEGTTAETGIPGAFDLTGGRSIQQDPTPVMVARFPDEAGGRYTEGPLYWRVTTHSQYSGNGWSREWINDPLEPGVSPLYPHHARHVVRDDPRVLSREPRPDKRPVRQAIYVDEVPQQGLPCLERVREVRLSGPADRGSIIWDRAMDFTVLLTARNPRRLSYEVVSEVGRPSANDLRRARGDYLNYMDGRDYRTLTEHRLRTETVALVEDLVRDEDTVYDKVTAIHRWLSGSDFEYTLDLPPLPPHFTVDTFINQTRQGHCELFASAMALMTRTLGVPARVVTGYRGGEWDDAAKAYTIRANMAHTWAEVWFPGHGWVTFDPSPRGAVQERFGIDRLKYLASLYQIRAKMFWYQQVIGFDRVAQFERLRSLFRGLAGNLWPDPAEGDPQAQATSPSLWRRISLRLPPIPGILLAAVLVLLLIRRFAGRRPQRRWHLSPDQQRAVALYKRLRRKMRRRGPRRARPAIDPRGKTAGELRAALQDQGGPSAEAAIRLLNIYEQTRFGLHPLPRQTYRKHIRTLGALRWGRS